VQPYTLESAKARPPRSSARRGRHHTLARAARARHQKGAQAQQQTIRFLDEAGFDPLPGVVRTDAPVDQTPIVREGWTRDHLSAMAARSPEGKLYFRSQDRAINADDVVDFLAPLRRQVPGQMGLSRDGAPLHRSPTLRELLTKGAAPRLHLARLPADAPELNPRRGPVATAQRGGAVPRMVR
jgi:DDE superfamily endonuclease